MKAYSVSKKSKLSLEKKINKINTYKVGELLYVLREYEDSPGNFESEVIETLVNKLYTLGVMRI